MKKHFLLIGLLMSTTVPFSIFIQAAKASETCCYGTTCATSPNCIKSEVVDDFFTCKRTCSTSTPSCNEGQGCCQFKYSSCTYTNASGQTCTLKPMIAVVQVSFNNLKFCRNGANEVSCLATAENSCAY